jgi:ADP-dependent NAD(P)H-hydrate dehydratase / NAD(P)H-hydrate epimerase
MKILSAAQIRELDKYTIQHEPISSVDLMERAATAFTNAVTEMFRTNEQVLIFCGMGNNGGDGLAVARQLVERGYLHVTTYVVKHSPKASDDFEVNEERLKNISGIRYIETEFQIPQISKNAVVIDAIFGSGLSRRVDGITAALIKQINESGATVYSIDVPSGLFCDLPNDESDAVVQSDITFTFHAPKLSFLMPSSAPYIKQFEVLDIGLQKEFAVSIASPYRYVTHEHIRSVFKGRGRFSHKGTYGHVLLCAGSYGKMGAAVLTVNAALRSGAGLVSAFVPKCGYNILQTDCPEAMVLVDEQNDELSALPDAAKFDVIGAGPGIGVTESTAHFLSQLLHAGKPLVLDADALNLLAENRALLSKLPGSTVLTPHPGEFKRLAGDWKDDLHRLKLQVDFAAQYNVVVVLKGAHTAVALPNGTVYFNSTGNPGMAKGGSGDVLTGIITSLLAQEYSAEEAAVIGVFIHGKAGDYAAAYLSQTGMTAQDIIKYLPEAFGLFE